MVVGVWVVDDVLEIDSDVILAISLFGPPIFFIFFLGKYYDIASTYVYIRYCLKTNVSYKEASELTFLFEPDESGVWYPMSDIEFLPEQERRRALFETAKSIKQMEP
jgi:hypothetical protein